MFESGAICAYLADLHLDKGMAPPLSATIDAIQGQYAIIYRSHGHPAGGGELEGGRLPRVT